MKAGEERGMREVKRKREMQEEAWRERKIRGTGSGKGLRRKGEKRNHLNPSLWSPDLNQAPALQWTPMQQVKSMLSIYLLAPRDGCHILLS